MLSEMLGPRGVNFDNDDEPVPDEIDFAGDPILHLDMAVRITGCFTRSWADSRIGTTQGFPEGMCDT
jgi:hypothetical protein